MGEREALVSSPASIRQPVSVLPRLDADTAAAILVAGAGATVAFDFFGQGLSPALGFASLAPVPLARSVLESLFGFSTDAWANIIHYLTGLVFYPLGYVLVARPIAARLLPQAPWWLTATLYGIALWVFALYVMAHLIAGLPAFLAFNDITWVALIGHVLFTLVAALLLQPGRNGKAAWRA
jgi:hypothetical protein